MNPTTPIKAATAVLLAAGIFGASAANAASVSYFLDQSNELADGTNYLKVTISDGSGGLINFKVETLAPLNSIADTNFGIQSFDFNTSLATPSGPNADSVIVGLPTDWSGNVSPPPNNADGFGDFEFEVSNGGSNRLSVLTFSVDVAGDSINDYYELSSNPGNSPNPPLQGNVQFAAHVAGFTMQSCSTSTSGYCTGAYFGGGTPAAIPVPAAIWLFGSGLLGMTAVARRKMTS
jgi:hypothetical protein